ncbi:MAG: hypothetical protein ACKVZ0_06610 [Gemmatimonadales bacterium]
MLKPTVYVPSRPSCLTHVRWRLAEASLEALVAYHQREAARDQAQASATAPEPVVAGSASVD